MNLAAMRPELDKDIKPGSTKLSSSSIVQPNTINDTRSYLIGLSHAPSIAQQCSGSNVQPNTMRCEGWAQDRIWVDKAMDLH
jgi:hypothetical protein